MEALVYEAPETMVMRTRPVPDPAGDEALIRVAYAGICGSELSGFLGRNSLRRPPLVFGHELSGWVAALGDEVGDDLGLRVGDRVTANPLQSCGHCNYCISAREQLCERRQLLGAHLSGCNADFVAVPARSVMTLPPGLSLRDAAMVEPAACAVRAVELSGAGPDTTALVIGAGAIGMFLLEVLAVHGVQDRYVADLNPARLARAAATGAIPLLSDGDVVAALLAAHGRGVDIAYDAVGTDATRRACQAATAPGGRVMYIGLHAEEATLPVNVMVRSELATIGVFAYSRANFHTAFRWLAEGRIGLRAGVEVADLADGPGWYRRLVDGDDATKVLLQPRAGHEEGERG
jgi:threonine dehydrogenase-like Zn-dependent dehydrogenase